MMRAAEGIHLVVFSFFVVLAWIRGLPWPRRRKVTLLGATGLGATLMGAWLLPWWLPPLAVSVVRDWLPAALILLVYWQAGAFFLHPDQRLQGRLERFDEHVVAPLLRWLASHRLGKWIAAYLELAYLLCYAMVPLSVAALYLLRLGQHADRFWVVVLISAYTSYGCLPFLPTLPPRMRVEPWLTPLPANPIRTFNLWILGNASIHANTFPSAHVAASTAAALVFAALAPWPVALGFGLIAAGIGFGTFVGRYHFALDAIVGAVVAALVFAVTMWTGDV